MKTNIEIEVEIPDGQEFDKFEPLICQTLFGDIAFTGIAKLKPIEPPLELETEMFIDGDKIRSKHLYPEIKGSTNFVVDAFIEEESELRDLIKILNYRLTNKKLPERVTVKGGAK